MTALHTLHIQIQSPSCWVRTNGRITAVGKRTRLSIAEAGDIVLVAAEVGFCGFLVRGAVTREFQLERAKLLIDNLPDDLVGGHDCGVRKARLLKWEVWRELRPHCYVGLIVVIGDARSAESIWTLATWAQKVRNICQELDVVGKFPLLTPLPHVQDIFPR